MGNNICLVSGGIALLRSAGHTQGLLEFPGASQDLWKGSVRYAWDLQWGLNQYVLLVWHTWKQLVFTDYLHCAETSLGASVHSSSFLMTRWYRHIIPIFRGHGSGVW